MPQSLTVELAGELDMNAAMRAEVQLTAALEQTKHLIVDLRPVSFIDSTGLGMLIEVSQQARQRGVELSIIPGGPQVQRVIEMTGLDGELPLVAANGESR